MRIEIDHSTDRAGQPGVVVLALGFVVIFGLSVASVLFAPSNSDVAAWWPAAGVGTGLIALSSPRRWPALLLLGVFVTGAANFAGGRDPLVSGLFGLANATEWFVVAVVLGAHRARPFLRSRGDFALLIVAAGIGALVIGFLAGAIVRLGVNGSLLETMTSVTASHLASQLLVVPAMLLLSDTKARPRIDVSHVVVGLQVVSTLAVTVLVHRSGQSLPLSFLPLPFLVWGALVLSLRSLALEALVVGTLVTLLTAGGGGPFGNLMAVEPWATAALVQVNLVVIALVALPLALVMAERSAALVEALAGREESRRAQLELRREQDFTATLLAATTGTSIIATDERGRITFVNSGAENLLGYSPDDLIGQALSSLHQQDEVGDRMRELQVRSVFEAIVGEPGGAGRSHDWTYRRIDGGLMRVSLRMSPLLNPTGELVGYLAVGEDITSRQRTQESLRRLLETERAAVDRLSDLDSAKSEFLATVSHELRTPMTSILGFNQVLLSESVGPLNDRQSDLLRRVDRGGYRLMGLIENILALSRIENLKDASERTLVDMSGLIAAAVQATETLRWDRHLDLSVSVPAAGNTTVIGDQQQLERALINLVSNAVKFTPDGGSIELSMTETATSVLVQVKDTGIGIPLSEQPSLFDRFFRASNAVADSIQGTGLGLAIVQTIVEAHDGTLAVESAPHQGTAVAFEIPKSRGGGVQGDSGPAADQPADEVSDSTRATSSSASNGLTM